MQTTFTLTTFAAALLLAPASAYSAQPRSSVAWGKNSAVSRSAVSPRPVMIFGASTTEAPKKAVKGLKITEKEVEAAQDAWANGVVAIGKAFTEGGNHVAMATAAASDLYAYDYGNVLFKPTRCADMQFRPEAKDALSYFVGGYVEEDTGFAIQPWSNVDFNNHGVNICGDTAIAMGNYYFTDATTGDKSLVEYTFGYRKFEEGKVRIFLHHSSVPYQKPSAAPAAAAAPAGDKKASMTITSGEKHIHLYL